MTEATYGTKICPWCDGKRVCWFCLGEGVRGGKGCDECLRRKYCLSCNGAGLVPEDSP